MYGLPTKFLMLFVLNGVFQCDLWLYYKDGWERHLKFTRPLWLTDSAVYKFTSHNMDGIIMLKFELGLELVWSFFQGLYMVVFKLRISSSISSTLRYVLG